jgi:hypothetical protein
MTAVIPDLRHDYTDRDEVMGFQGAQQDVKPEWEQITEWL